MIPYLHVYAPSKEGDPVYVIGTRDGLTALAEATLVALAGTRPVHLAQTTEPPEGVLSGDGRGFVVHVLRLDHEGAFRSLMGHYSAPREIPSIEETILPETLVLDESALRGIERGR